jgi:cellulose biosynthesis protein BcsQ
VFASFKGGVWKTSLAVATAERTAWAGLQVLFVTSDRQEDARSRFGIKPSEPLIARREYGRGSVTVLAARQDQAIELLYVQGPTQLGIGTYDLAIVDTPPEEHGGSLPGVFLVAITDGTDASRNLLTTLRTTPDNTEIMLVRVHRIPSEEWEQEVAVLERLTQRSMHYLDEPLPRVDAVKEACDNGRSVWSIPRRKPTTDFLSGVDTLAHQAWHRTGRQGQWPSMPPPGSKPLYVPGWSRNAR